MELEAELVDVLTQDVFDVILTNPGTGDVISEVLIRNEYTSNQMCHKSCPQVDLAIHYNYIREKVCH